MRSRLALGGLALAVAAALTVPASAAPVRVTPAPPGSLGAPLPTDGVSVALPQVLQRDRLVHALVQLDGDPVAVLRARSGGDLGRREAERRVARDQDAVLPRLRAAGARVEGRLDTVLNAVQVRATLADLATIARTDGVRHVQPSRIVRLADADSNRFTGVPQAWQDLGRTGRGQVIGVVDTGIDYTHADFGGPGTEDAFLANRGSVVEAGSFPTAKVTGGQDLVGDLFDASSSDESRLVPHPDADPLDCDGHGTHVAGTAAGAGVTAAGATYTGPYTAAALDQPFAVSPGAAPAATLRSYRVFGCSGSTRDDIVAAALDRAVADGVDVLNLSLSTAYGTRDDLEIQAVQAAAKAGVLVVGAAGNSGPGGYLTSSPATADAALAVAAVDATPELFAGAPNPDRGRVAGLSSGGPRRLDSAQKPDLAAPGVNVSSAALGTGTASTALSGTSTAAPHVAGIAALVRQAHPSWTPLQVKAALMSSAATAPLQGYDSRRLGTGLVQARQAVAAQAYAWTSSGLNSLSFGMNQLSGTHYESKSFKITNRSRSSVSYTLGTTLSSARMGVDLTVSPRTVTVGAGATADVKLTLHYSKADVAKLPGADRSEDGRVTSLHGVVTATPKSRPAGIGTLRMAFVSVPVPLSSVTSSTTVKPTGGGRYGAIKLTNSGRHTGTADLYQALLKDPAGDASTSETADLTDLGVQATAVAGDPADRLVVFAAGQARGTSTQGTHEVDVEIDTDGDGIADYLTYAADSGLMRGEEADGTISAFTITAADHRLVDLRRASAPTNGSTVLLPVLASSIGVTATSPAFRVSATGFSLTGDGGYDVVSGTGRFQPFRPALNQGQRVKLDPGTSASVTTRVDAAQTSRQTVTGWLVVTPDDAAGRAEVDRVGLQLAPKS